MLCWFDMKVLLFLLLGLGLTGCTGPPRKFPWLLEGVTIPSFQVVSRSEVSVEGSVNFALSVVTAARTRGDLTLVAQKVIESLPPHNLAVIFFYRDVAEVVDQKEFTVGRAWWGVKREDAFPKPGDYSINVLEVLLPVEKVAPVGGPNE